MQTFTKQIQDFLSNLHLMEGITVSKPTSVRGNLLKNKILQEGDFSTFAGVSIIGEQLRLHLVEHSDVDLKKLYDNMCEQFQKNSLRCQILSIAEGLSNSPETLPSKELLGALNGLLLESDSQLKFRLAEGVSRYQYDHQTLRALTEKVRGEMVMKENASQFQTFNPLAYVKEHNGSKYVRLGKNFFAITESGLVEVTQAPVDFIKYSNLMHEHAQISSCDKGFVVQVGEAQYKVDESGISHNGVAYHKERFLDIASKLEESLHPAAETVLFITENFNDMFILDEMVQVQNDLGDLVLVGKFNNTNITLVSEGRYPVGCKFHATLEEAVQMASSMTNVDLTSHFSSKIQEEKDVEEQKIQEAKNKNIQISKLVSEIQKVDEQINGAKVGSPYHFKLSESRELLTKKLDLVKNGEKAPLSLNEQIKYHKSNESNKIQETNMKRRKLSSDEKNQIRESIRKSRRRKESKVEDLRESRRGRRMSLSERKEELIREARRKRIEERRSSRRGRKMNLSERKEELIREARESRRKAARSSRLKESRRGRRGESIEERRSERRTSRRSESNLSRREKQILEARRERIKRYRENRIEESKARRSRTGRMSESRRSRNTRRRRK